MLESVTTTLPDIQERLLKLITAKTILVGHSLNSDLNALKLTHPFIVDTSVVYPHPRGPPLRSSLKWLAQKYLLREIQQSHGTTGHDSVEDARACLDLIKQKCQKGRAWGTSEATNESIFKRLGRSTRPKSLSTSGVDEYRTGAVVDWGDPRRGFGGAAEVCIGCNTDEDVVKGVQSVITGQGAAEDPRIPASGVDFVWARFRELEALRGWWNKSKSADNEELRKQALEAVTHAVDGDGRRADVSGGVLATAVSRTVSRILSIHAALPACTAFIVYSGTGDPRELTRLQALQQQFKREYSVRKWDEISVSWTNVEEQALSRACREARASIGFLTVK
jgi:RNA exonuclease 1